MNRTDRLYAIVEELRATSPRPRTGRALAAHFEVSIRTIERDISALLQAGVPIYADRGRGGGYTLDRDRTLPPVNVTAAEVAAATVALRSLDGTPFHDAARSLVQKLLAVMPRAEVERGEALTRRIQLVGRPPGGTVARAVGEALTARRVLLLRYLDKHGRASERRVEPIGFICLAGVWYLQARCRLRGEDRVFRVDRIARATATGETVPPVVVDPVLLDLPGATATRLSLAAATGAGVRAVTAPAA